MNLFMLYLTVLQFELEKELNNQLTSLQTAIGPEPPLKTSLLEDESGMIHELTQVCIVLLSNNLTFRVTSLFPPKTMCLNLKDRVEKSTSNCSLLVGSRI